MSPKQTLFAQKFTSDSGIVSLMEDLGDALNVNPDLLFLGGGNPARIEKFEERMAVHLQKIIKDKGAFNKLIGVYQSSQGSEEFIAELVKYFRKQCGWNITEKNIVITSGSQSAFFLLINTLSQNSFKEGQARKNICFPIMPEYLGYSDQGIDEGTMVGNLPRIELHENNQFKYHVDFDGLDLNENTAALCISRPTNPTGNVISSEELEQLTQLAKDHSAPLIVDCAYGNPFPGVIYEQVETLWNPQSIFVMSLSKLGLPGARTGIVVANEEVVQAITRASTIMSLACGNLGPSLMTSVLKNGELASLCETTLLPFYRTRRDFAVKCIESHLTGVPYKLHKPEGAFFVWLWFPGLPISSTELYERLKSKGVLIMDGALFFYGLSEQTDHSTQCIRLTYCQSEKVIEDAIYILSQELKSVYEKG